MSVKEVNLILILQCKGIICLDNIDTLSIDNYMFMCLLIYHNMILYFRQKSIDSEKNPTLPVVEQQAKLIEIEKAETGSVRLLLNSCSNLMFNVFFCFKMSR